MGHDRYHEHEHGQEHGHDHDGRRAMRGTRGRFGDGRGDRSGWGGGRRMRGGDIRRAILQALRDAGPRLRGDVPSFSFAPSGTTASSAIQLPDRGVPRPRSSWSRLAPFRCISGRKERSEYGFARIGVVGAKGKIPDRIELGTKRVEFRPDQSVGITAKDQMVSIAARMHFLIDRSCGVRRIAWELLGFYVLHNLAEPAGSGFIVVDN